MASGSRGYFPMPCFLISEGGTGLRHSTYDPAVLQQFADWLYRKARWTIFRWTVMGVTVGLLGLLAGFELIDQSTSAIPELPRRWEAYGDIVRLGVVWGWFVGCV